MRKHLRLPNIGFLADRLHLSQILLRSSEFPLFVMKTAPCEIRCYIYFEGLFPRIYPSNTKVNDNTY